MTNNPIRGTTPPSRQANRQAGRQAGRLKAIGFASFHLPSLVPAANIHKACGRHKDFSIPIQGPSVGRPGGATSN